MAKSGDSKDATVPAAELSAAPVLDPVAVDQVVLVRLDLIDATDRLRAVNEAYAQVLAAAFQGPGGQRTPIEIVRRGERYRLVFGAHRFRAAEIAGWSEIRAIVTDATDAELRLREIDENLIRHELTALDRARFLLERKRIYEALTFTNASPTGWTSRCPRLCWVRPERRTWPTSRCKARTRRSGTSGPAEATSPV